MNLTLTKQNKGGYLHITFRFGKSSCRVAVTPRKLGSSFSSFNNLQASYTATLLLKKKLKFILGLSLIEGQVSSLKKI